MEKEEKDKPAATAEWSEQIEKVLIDIENSCRGYKFMCITTANRNSIRYDGLMFTLLVLSPISGAMSAISVANPDHSSALQIVITIFTMVTGILTAILKFSKFDQKSMTNKTIAAKYASLENNIRRQLSLNRNERVNAGKYLEWISASYDELFSSTPLMPDDVYKKWVDVAVKNSISVPKELEKVTVDKTDIEIIKKNDTLADLNRYADGKMKYEMERLKGHE